MGPSLHDSQPIPRIDRAYGILTSAGRETFAGIETLVTLTIGQWPPIEERARSLKTEDEAEQQPRSLTVKQQRITDNLNQLLDVLPPPIRQGLERAESLEDLIEIVLDLGREPEARF